MLLWVIYIFGVIGVCKFLGRLWRAFLPFFCSPDLSRYGKGSWVLITGATDGIGKGYAAWFSQRQFNVAIVGRNAAKLASVKSELEKNSSAKVKTILRDFTRSYEPGFFAGLVAELEDLDVSILVNNVGIFEAEILGNHSEEAVKSTVSVNTIAQACLSNALVQRLNTRARRSAIIDIASLSSIEGGGWEPIYSATKAFNRYLTIGTDRSRLFRNVDFLSVNPGYVKTAIGGGIVPDLLLTSTVEDCVGASMKALGVVNQTYGSLKSNIHGLNRELWYNALGNRFGMPVYNVCCSLIESLKSK